MKRQFIHVLSISALVGGLLSACNFDSATTSSLLVTQPDANGMVTVMSVGGGMARGSGVTLQNTAMGVWTQKSAAQDGSFVGLLSAGASDLLRIRYQDSTGTEVEEEVQPQQELVAVHGTVTLVDPDGAEGPEPGCYHLIRDDLPADSTDPADLVLIPGCKGQGHHGGQGHEEGDQNGDKDGDGHQPPPEGASPPPEGSEPPPQGQGCGCPPPGEEPPPPEATPPADQSPPPHEEGENPMSFLDPFVGQVVTVVGAYREPKEDMPCEGEPFAVFGISGGDSGSAPAMEGILETATVSSSAVVDDCVTFRRTDLVDEEGNAVSDLEERFELGGPGGELLLSDETLLGQSLILIGHPFHGPSVCGFPMLDVSAWSLATEE